MQAAVINILINLQSKQLGNYGDVKICFPLPLHSTGTDRAFKFLNMPFMFSRALKSLWTVSLLGDAPSSPIPTGRLAILFIQWQEVLGFSLLLQLDSRKPSPPVCFRPSLLSSLSRWHNCTALFFCQTSICFLFFFFQFALFYRREEDKHLQPSYQWDNSFPEFPVKRFHLKYDDSTTGKTRLWEWEAEPSHCVPYVRGTSSWGTRMGIDNIVLILMMALLNS